ncbi:MAG: DUF309 domain-containing protein [Candidatus Limnocylindrales bacterium]
MAAYDRGDAFLAHELLEPAWMGTADAPERELYQGLIKLAAAEVHAVRGNPPGEAKNLQGALRHLDALGEDGPDAGLDLAALRGSVRARLGQLEGQAQGRPAEPSRRRPEGGSPTIPLPYRSA